MKFDNFEAVDNGFVNFISVPQSVGYEVKATDIFDFRSNLWIIKKHIENHYGNTSPIVAPLSANAGWDNAPYVAPNTNGTRAKLIVRLEKNPSVPYNRTYELEAINRFKQFRGSAIYYMNTLGNSSFYDYSYAWTNALDEILGASENEPTITGCSESNRIINSAWRGFNIDFAPKGYRLVVLIMNYDIVLPSPPSGYSSIYSDSYSIPMDVGRQRRLYVQVQARNPYNPFSTTSSLNLNFMPYLRLLASRSAVKDYLSTTLLFTQNNGLILPSASATNLFLNNIQQLNIPNGISVVTNATNT